MRRAAFFDMDRTLVRRNTANSYLWWRLERGETTLRQTLRAFGWLAQYSVGAIDATRVTREAIGWLEGIEEARFRQECLEWFARSVLPHVSSDARAEVQRHRARGDVCVILTASTAYASEPLAEELGIDHVLCTTLEVRDGRFTGRWDELCYGAGKVARAERWADEHGVDLGASTFYTDSVSDVPMLERVGVPHVVNPDPRLRLRAATRGWKVSRWR